MNDKFLKTENENFNGEGGVIPSLVAENNSFNTSYSIDYLTFSFPFEFRYPLDALNANDIQYYRLLNVLNSLYLSKDTAEDTFSSNGFEFAYKWQVPVEYVGEKKPSTRLSYYLVANDLDIGNIEMSGACCRDLERRYRYKTGDMEVDDLWKELFEKVINIKGSFSRIDIAFDLFDVPEEHSFIWFYKKICLERSYSSPIGSIKQKIDCDDRTNTYNEQTFTIGSDQSLINICIYNKKLEQLQQGKACGHKSWVRIEIRFKKDRANAFIAGLIKNWENKTSYCVGVLKHYLQIKEKPKFYDPMEWVPRKIRKGWPTNEFWQGLFEDTEKLKLVHLEDNTTLIQKKKQYTNSNLSQFITSIRYSMDSNPFKLLIASVCARGISNLKAKDIELINFERRKNNLKPLEKEDIEAIQKELDSVKTELSKDPNNVIQVGNIDVVPKQLNDLKSQIEKYEERKDLDEFLKILKDCLKHDFNNMSQKEIESLISGILKIFK